MAVLTHWEGEPTQVWAQVWGIPRLEAHDVIGSTNDRARELAGEGAEPFTVVVAGEQRTGRGRSGDVWHSPPGAGLWMSVLLGRPSAPSLPLRVGLAAARAVEGVCQGVRVGIKWPNDLEVDGRKLGGILCEQARSTVVAGVGINVRQRSEDFPEAFRGRATSLEVASGADVALAPLAAGLVGQLRALCGASDTEPEALSEKLRAELARRDVLDGLRVTTQQAGDGIARGIDETGALVVEGEDGRRVRIVAGSVRTL